MRRRFAHWLHELSDEAIVLVLAFWILQLVLWIAMMFVVQFIAPSLGKSVLYVTQISHWALVEAAGTATVSTVVLLQAKHNRRALHDAERRVIDTVASGQDITALEHDIARLAELQPGPEGKALADQICTRLKAQ